MGPQTLNAYFPGAKKITLTSDASLYVRFHEEAHRQQHLGNALVFKVWKIGRYIFGLDYLVTLWIEWDAMRRARQIMQTTGVWNEQYQREAYRALKTYVVNLALVRAVILATLIVVMASCSRGQSVETATPTPAPTPRSTATPIPFRVGLPTPPPLPVKAKEFLISTGGHGLILEFETGGRSGYDPHPEWPGHVSGITVGIGYDCGYFSPAVIESDWHSLGEMPRARLARVSGKTGQRALTLLSSVRDIYVQWQLAIDVFDHVDVAREYANGRKAMPGFEDLRPNCQAALISLGFNRGWSLLGANRSEMRDIRDSVPTQNYPRIASSLRKMVRVWRGTKIENGMTRRRLAEARLVETP